MLCRCGCVTKACSLCLASSLATKLTIVNFIVTLGSFLGFLCYVLCAKLGAVLLFCCCGCVTKLCSLCLAGSLAPKLKSQFYSRSESNVRPLGPLPAGPVRPSEPCCLGVAEASFLSLESSKMATFLIGSESNVRQQGP